jgi:hypothetical protein
MTVHFDLPSIRPSIRSHCAVESALPSAFIGAPNSLFDVGSSSDYQMTRSRSLGVS